MHIRTTLIALLSAGLAVSLPAAAQDLTPGLWELTNNMSFTNGEQQVNMADINRMLASLSPEQRKSVQQLAQQNGVQLDVGADGLRSKMCMTREMIERKEVPMQEGDCSHKLTPMGANQLRVAFSCTRPHARGEGVMTIDSPTTYHARVKVRNEDQPDQIADMDVTGRWLGADCGDVRPMALPASKRHK